MLLIRLPKTVALFFVMIALSSCSLLQPYQAELGQGNYIREDQVDQLEIGQTPDQVVFLLGTPLLTGEQQTNRWLYPQFESEGGYSTLVITFADGIVSAIETK